MPKATRFHALADHFGAVVGLCFATTSLDADAPQVNVEAGQSIQSAIDSAGDGAVIHIAAGAFPERITITKSLTVVGTGWDKTIIRPEKVSKRTQAEKDAFFQKLDAAKTLQERQRLALEVAGRFAEADTDRQYVLEKRQGHPKRREGTAAAGRE